MDWRLQYHGLVWVITGVTFEGSLESGPVIIGFGLSCSFSGWWGPWWSILWKCIDQLSYCLFPVSSTPYRWTWWEVYSTLCGYWQRPFLETVVLSTSVSIYMSLPLSLTVWVCLSLHDTKRWYNKPLQDTSNSNKGTETGSILHWFAEASNKL